MQESYGKSHPHSKSITLVIVEFLFGTNVWYLVITRLKSCYSNTVVADICQYISRLDMH